MTTPAIAAGDIVAGLEPDEHVEVSKVTAFGTKSLVEGVGVTSRRLIRRPLGADELARLVKIRGSSFTYDGNARAFLLGVEAHRIKTAYQFDHLFAVNSSAVDVAERLADGVAVDLEVTSAAEALANDCENKGCGSDAAENADCYAAEAANKALGETTYAHAAARYAAWETVAARNPWDADCTDEQLWKKYQAIITTASDAEDLAQSHLLRCIFANPFHPVALNTAWQNPTVLALATAAYDNRILPAGTLEPARLAILADALEEAGGDNADILAHCRQPGEHVRGCWVVDLILGKE